MQGVFAGKMAPAPAPRSSYPTLRLSILPSMPLPLPFRPHTASERRCASRRLTLRRTLYCTLPLVTCSQTFSRSSVVPPVGSVQNLSR
jgi:hypothetical protein